MNTLSPLSCKWAATDWRAPMLHYGFAAIALMFLLVSESWAQQQIITSYSYDDVNGLVSEKDVAGPDGTNKEVTKYTYGFEQYSGMNGPHMLSQLSRVRRLVSSSGGQYVDTQTQWGSFNGAFRQTAILNYLNSNDTWITSSTYGYDQYGNINSVIDANGATNTYIYGYNGTRLFAVVKNAVSGECGYSGLEDGSQDWEAGWTSIDGSQSHSGQYSAYCDYAYGPTKNFYVANGLDRSKSYTLDAWVKVVSGTGMIMIEKRDSSNNWIFGYNRTITTAGGTGWQHVSVTITPDEMADLPGDGHLRVWCGFPDASSNAGYVDDVRFFPIGSEMTTMTYDPSTFQMTSKSDADNNPTYYVYDALQRLTDVEDYAGRTIAHYTYYYSRTGNPNDLYTGAQPNYIESNLYTDANDYVDKRQFFDGLGREIQDQTSDASSTIVNSTTVYDSQDRDSLVYRPYLISGGLNYDPNYASNVGGYYSQFGVGGPYYSQTVYCSDPLSRKSEQGFPGSAWSVNSNPKHDLRYSYSSASNNWYEYSTLDENSVANDTYKDLLDRVVQTVQHPGGADLITGFEYDMVGDLTQTTTPEAGIIPTTYTYNTLKQVVQKTTPDAGTTQYLYDKQGNLRFIWDANHQFIYHKYDHLDRLTEEGVYNTGSSNINLNDYQNDAYDPGFPSSNALVQEKFYYDSPGPDSGPTDQENLIGRLSYSESYDASGSLVVRTSYSYDKMGLVSWISYDFPNRTSPIYVQYWYDLQGNVVEKGTSTLGGGCVGDILYTFYEYDAAGRLHTVSTSEDQAGGHQVLQATYDYFASGKPSQLTLGSSPAATIKYRYNERDWLVADSSMDFWEQIGYNTPSDLASLANVNPQYNGNISWDAYCLGGASPVYFKDPVNGGGTPIVGYAYGYDGANRLQAASFGYYLYEWGSTPSYGVPSISYFNDGEINSLERYGSGTSITDALMYHYVPGTHKLASIVNGASGPSSNYSYDSDGNMTSDSRLGITSISYDFRNLPWQVVNSGGTINYWYDANGNRIRKKSGPTDEQYILGKDGETLAVYNTNAGVEFYNILSGDEIIGRIVWDVAAQQEPPQPPPPSGPPPTQY